MLMWHFRNAYDHSTHIYFTWFKCEVTETELWTFWNKRLYTFLTGLDNHPLLACNCSNSFPSKKFLEKVRRWEELIHLLLTMGNFTAVFFILKKKFSWWGREAVNRTLNIDNMVWEITFCISSHFITDIKINLDFFSPACNNICPCYLVVTVCQNVLVF